MAHKHFKIALFSSGSGSNAEKIIEYFKNHPSISVEILYANNKNAFALQRAERLGVATRVFNRQDFYESDTIVTELINSGISWIILAGFLWLIPENLIQAYPEKIINIHPALLPKYGGKGMYGMHVHEAVVAANEKESGISIHLVNPIFDNGEILFQAKCDLNREDTPKDVAAKVLELEHFHFPRIIEKQILQHIL